MRGEREIEKGGEEGREGGREGGRVKGKMHRIFMSMIKENE